MDTLTHALSGALVGRLVVPSGAKPVTPADCVALGFCAAAFPDSDVILSLFSPLAYLLHHRGATHSLLLLPLWAAILAWIWSRVRRNPAGWRIYFLVAAVAIGIHILGDLITSFGTIIFAPFSDLRVAWSTTFIIDLWLSGILVVGLVACGVFRRSRIPSAVGLCVLSGYVGFQHIQQQRAVAFGIEHARAHAIATTKVSAVPRPVSPFNWMVVIEESERYHYAMVNLRREQPMTAAPGDGLVRRLDAPYLPMRAAQWVTVERLGASPAERMLAEHVWGEAQFGFFRWFAAYPVLSGVEAGNPSTCVWFRDLRFLTPGRGVWPFEYGMCREGDNGPWQAYEREDGQRIAL